MAKLLKLSATQIDNILYHLKNDSSIEEIEQSLTKKDNELMQRGRFFHELVAMDEYELKVYDHMGYYTNGTFSYPKDLIAEMQRRINPEAIPEVKFRKDYKGVILTGMADYLIGMDIDELKTTWSGFSYDKYYQSFQWKMYLDLFEADSVRYIVAELRHDESTARLVDIHEFTFTRNDLPDVSKTYEYVAYFLRKTELSKYFEVEDVDPNDFITF